EGSMSHHCTRCDAITDVTVIPLADHSYGEWVVTQEATCNATGEETRTCANCYATETRTTEKDPTNHIGTTYVVGYVAATCGVDGYSGDTYCSDCDTLLESGEVISATENHTYGEWKVVTEATCGADGLKQRVCSVCEAVEEEAIPATGAHSYVGVVTKDASCGTTGIMTYTCSVCENSYTEVIPATSEHHYVTFEGKAATCTEDGYSDWVECLFCGDIQTASEVIPALGHIDEDGDGYCDRCQEPVETTDDPSGSGSGSSSGSSSSSGKLSWDEYHCSYCDKYDAVKDIPFVGWIYAIVHFFVHLAHYISYIT
ncbi:MAG: hypothetical protein LUG85_00300, partial [Clostridiales bacterium]|nr:hypothetical protein [Clostridiales bacterium]